MKILNLTHTEITIKTPNGPHPTITIQPRPYKEGGAAMVNTKRRPHQTLPNGVKIKTLSNHETINLPDQEPDTILIVSAIVRANNPHRSDLASPGGVKRNGGPVTCEFLVINEPTA
jgi:hypothetical protein